MTTEEKIIRKSIIKINKRLHDINVILDAAPLLEIIEIRKEAQDFLIANPTIDQRTSEQALYKMNELSKKEKEMFEIANKQKNSVHLIDEKVKLTMELGDLKNRLFYIEMKK
jgi:hypothetical protein